MSSLTFGRLQDEKAALGNVLAATVATAFCLNATVKCNRANNPSWWDGIQGGDLIKPNVIGETWTLFVLLPNNITLLALCRVESPVLSSSERAGVLPQRPNPCLTRGRIQYMICNKAANPPEISLIVWVRQLHRKTRWFRSLALFQVLRSTDNKRSYSVSNPLVHVPISTKVLEVIGSWTWLHSQHRGINRCPFPLMHNLITVQWNGTNHMLVFK